MAKPNEAWPERELSKISAISGGRYRNYWNKANSQDDNGKAGWQVFLRPNRGGLAAAKAEAKRPDVNVTKNDLAIPALYEFAIVHPRLPNKRIKTYVGETNNLKKRHGQYLSESETLRMGPYMEQALVSGNLILRRFRYCYNGPRLQDGTPDVSRYDVGKLAREADKKRAKRMETMFLGFYDYAWNGEANPEKRTVWIEHQQTTIFFCFPASKYILKTELQAGRLKGGMREIRLD